LLLSFLMRAHVSAACNSIFVKYIIYIYIYCGCTLPVCVFVSIKW
jgi:hypothetical protein